MNRIDNSKYGQLHISVAIADFMEALHEYFGRTVGIKGKNYRERAAHPGADRAFVMAWERNVKTAHMHKFVC